MTKMSAPEMITMMMMMKTTQKKKRKDNKKPTQIEMKKQIYVHNIKKK